MHTEASGRTAGVECQLTAPQAVAHPHQRYWRPNQSKAGAGFHARVFYTKCFTKTHPSRNSSCTEFAQKTCNILNSPHEQVYCILWFSPCEANRARNPGEGANHLGSHGCANRRNLDGLLTGNQQIGRWALFYFYGIPCESLCQSTSQNMTIPMKELFCEDAKRYACQGDGSILCI